jgi:hypothetical protein
MKNTKGLSDVITTLIIILLVIAAIGIIWAVVNPFIKGAGEDFDISTKCMATSIDIVSATCNNDLTNCNVTLKRSDGDDEIAGVKLIFYNEAGTQNSIQDKPGNIARLATSTITGLNLTVDGLSDASKLSIAPYFTDGSGNEQLCDETGSQNVNVASA